MGMLTMGARLSENLRFMLGAAVVVERTAVVRCRGQEHAGETKRGSGGSGRAAGLRVVGMEGS